MIHQQGSAQTLGVARVLVFGLWLVSVLSVPLQEYANLQRLFRMPHGVLRLIPSTWWDAMWTPAFTFGIRAILVGLLAWLVLGLGRYRVVAIAACLLLTVFDGMAMSASHPGYSQLALLFSAFLLAGFPANDAVALRTGPKATGTAAGYGLPMLAAAVLICLSYALVGASQIFGSESRPLDPEIQNPGAALRLVIGAALVLAPLCIVSKRFGWLWVALVAPLHFAPLNLPTLFIWQNAFLLLLFATDSDRFLRPTRSEGERPVVFFDGSCVMCNRAAQLLLLLDREQLFDVAPLEGETARARLAPFELDEDVDSIVLVDERGCHVRSDSVLGISGRLGGLWSASRLLYALPRALRDVLYDFIARNRLRWFGSVESCELLSQDQRSRLLD